MCRLIFRLAIIKLLMLQTNKPVRALCLADTAGMNYLYSQRGNRLKVVASGLIVKSQVITRGQSESLALWNYRTDIMSVTPA